MSKVEHRKWTYDDWSASFYQNLIDEHNALYDALVALRELDRARRNFNLSGTVRQQEADMAEITRCIDKCRALGAIE